MDRLEMVLDATHLSDTSFCQAMDHYPRPVHASHQNCRALVPGDRQFSNEQLKLVIERGGVIRSAPDAWMLHTGWVRGRKRCSSISHPVRHEGATVIEIREHPGDSDACGIRGRQIGARNRRAPNYRLTVPTAMESE